MCGGWPGKRIHPGSKKKKSKRDPSKRYDWESKEGKTRGLGSRKGGGGKKNGSEKQQKTLGGGALFGKPAKGGQSVQGPLQKNQ